MKNKKNEVHISRNIVQLPIEPLSLWSGCFLEGAVKNQYQCVGSADGIIATVLQVGKTSKVIGQGDLFVTVKVVASCAPAWFDVSSAPPKRLVENQNPLAFFPAELTISGDGVSPAASTSAQGTFCRVSDTWLRCSARTARRLSRL